MVFITEMKSVYSVVQTGSLNKAVWPSAVKGQSSYIFPIAIQGISFMAAPSMAVLSYRKPSFAGTFLDRCAAQGSDKRNTLFEIPIC
jgi:hypothetical protein